MGKDGRFVTEEEYPKFVRQEIIVNAATHQSYSISGTEIQVKMFDDRIVVESPGKLPGLVRANNIRHTHFSRNPRIAEFLKAYKFVKEYGEGVDRMCRELEEAGLQEPRYDCDAFILKTIIYNADSQKLAIGEEKPAIGEEKLAIDYIKLAIAEKKYKKPTEKNILQIYENIDTNQIFGTTEIVKILGCSASGARTLMEKLRGMQVVCEVKGKGKGKYRFLNEVRNK